MYANCVGEMQNQVPKCKISTEIREQINADILIEHHTCVRWLIFCCLPYLHRLLLLLTRQGSARYVGAPQILEDYSQFSWGGVAVVEEASQAQARVQWGAGKDLSWVISEGDFRLASLDSFKRGVVRSKSLFSFPPRSVSVIWNPFLYNSLSK